MMIHRIKEIIARNLDIPMKEIQMDTNIIHDLGADSLDIATILIDIEDAFDLVFPDEIAEQIYNLKDIIIYVSPQLNPFQYGTPLYRA